MEPTYGLPAAWTQPGVERAVLLCAFVVSLSVGCARLFFSSTFETPIGATAEDAMVLEEILQVTGGLRRYPKLQLLAALKDFVAILAAPVLVAASLQTGLAMSKRNALFTVAEMLLMTLAYLRLAARTERGAHFYKALNSQIVFWTATLFSTQLLRMLWKSSRGHRGEWSWAAATFGIWAAVELCTPNVPPTQGSKNLDDDVQLQESSHPPPFVEAEAPITSLTITALTPWLIRHVFGHASYDQATLPDLPDNVQVVMPWAQYRAVSSSRQRWALWWKLSWSLRGSFASAFAWASTRAIGLLLAPFTLSLFLGVFNGTAVETQTKVSMLGLLFAGIMVSQWTTGQANRANILLMARVKSVLTSEVFSKGLQLRAGRSIAGADTDLGRLQNLISTDVAAIVAALFQFSQVTIEGPVGLTTSTAALAYLVGWRTAAFSLFLHLTLFPLRYYAARLTYRLQRDLRGVADERVRLASESIQAIRLIKMNGWEDVFDARMTAIRAREISLARRISRWRALESGLITASSAYAVAGTLAFHTLVLGHPLTPEIAFPMSLLVRIMATNLIRLALGIAGVLKATISMQRLNAYLNDEEAPPFPTQHSTTELGIEGLTATWPSLSEEPVHWTLSGSLRFPKDALSIIVGPVGSGKTALLLALLGELHAESGHRVIDPDATIAYCCQQPFLLSDTIRNNILFGDTYIESRYRQVIDAVALRPDLDVLVNGDESFVGENGIILSGGQRARVSLARALYSSSSILLLDDVLRACDAQTQYHIVQQGLCGPLVQERTVVLVTHAVDLCAPVARTAVLLERGRVTAAGAPAKVLDKVRGELSQSDTQEAEDSEPKKERGVRDEDLDEIAALGVVQVRIFRDLFRLFGIIFAVASIVLAMSTDTLRVFTYAMVGRISDRAAAGSEAEASLWWKYAVCVLFFFITNSMRNLVMTHRNLSVARRIHGQLYTGLLGAMPRFFDVVPLGRVLNRLTGDVDAMDGTFVYESHWTLADTSQIGSYLIGISLVKPVFLLYVVGIIAVYGLFGYIYITASRELKRAESVAHSPVQSLFAEILLGLTTIRAYKASVRLMRDHIHNLTKHVRAFYNRNMIVRWFSFWQNLLSSAIAVSSGILLLVDQRTTPATAGFVMSSALVVGELTWLWLQHYVQCDMSLTSIERIDEYAHLPQEDNDGLPPASDSYSEYALDLRELSIRHAPHLPLVINNLTFAVKRGERVAIVGRTGAGKSSLVSALFRAVQIVGGEIRVDDEDISTLALREHRSRMTFIQQDPLLVSGTLHYALDIVGEADDAELWTVLERVGMRHQISSLEMMVEAGGTNFSAGQRQQLALARGLLKLRKGSRFLILDEASSSLDANTDALIQQAIRKETRDCTVLCIAHRLRTIADYDRVLVLGAQGKLLEYAPPAQLLADETSAFAALARETGEYEELVKLAARGNM